MEELFTPPFGMELVTKKRKLRRELLDSGAEFIDKRIAVLGGSTTHDVVGVLELFLLHFGIRPTFYESEYDQYWNDAVFPNPELEAFAPDVIYIHTSNRNVLRWPALGESADDVDALLEETYGRFFAMWESLREKYGCPIIQNNFEFPDWRLQGNREASDIHGRVHFLTRLNLKCAEYAQTHENFYINDINYLSALYGLERWNDPFYWHMYKCSPAQPAIPYLAQSVANIIKSLYGKNKKAFALDLDNTLWGGVVGDDGAENLQIGQETSEGQAYSEFQSYLKEHRQLGVILNVVSKNEPENAMAGLRRPDMTLTEDDFIMIKANWEPKSQNLIDIAHTLSLTPDSFVFADDNPAEREIIRQQAPGVAVPELGDKPEYYIRAVDRMGYFEVTTLSADDEARTRMYRQNAERSRAEATFADYGAYLRSLEMEAEIDGFAPLYLSRIAQLTNKSNQFNLTTLRCSQPDVAAMAESDAYITLYGKLTDRFGDNGVVSVVAGKLDGDRLDIVLWLMSCRVLQRNMEFAMLDALVHRAKARGVRTLAGHYYPTAKNAMVREFYRTMGFTKVAEDERGSTDWEFVIPAHYENRQDVIKVHGVEEDGK